MLMVHTALWSQAAWKDPACVFTPLTTDNLAGGVRILVTRDASFAVRSGGHMPVAGHASIGRSVVVNLHPVDED